MADLAAEDSEVDLVVEASAAVLVAEDFMVVLAAEDLAADLVAEDFMAVGDIDLLLIADLTVAVCLGDAFVPLYCR